MTYATCPKCQYTRRPSEDTSPQSCPACGIVFSKWEKYHAQGGDPTALKSTIVIYEREPESPWRELLLGDPKTDYLAWSGRCLALIGLILWGGWFFVHGPADYMAVGESFLHRVDLVFHEAGHVVFMPFGDFMHIAGGSLGQLLMPFIVMLTFLHQRNPFGAAVGLWWLGQSAMDVAIYIDDARALQLPLLGGGTGYDDPGRHDWNNLLNRMGLLHRDHALAGLTYLMGRLAMLAACGWALALLVLQHRYLRDRGP